MKVKMLLFVLAVLLASCQPVINPIPDIQEVTRIVEQTVKVIQIVEQTLEVPKIVKETVIQTELVEITPTKQPISSSEFELKPEYFDAMKALFNHFNYLDMKDCEAHYYARSKHNQRNSLEGTIVYCEKTVGNVEVVYIYPFNYQYYFEGKRIVKEPEGHIYLISFVLWEEMSLGEMVERPIFFYVDMLWEDNEWKVNSTNSSPF